MFETIGRGWAITKLSFGVIRQDSEMLLFPLLGGFFSLAYSFVIMWPTVLTQLMDPAGDSMVWGTAQTVASFAAYFGLAFIATFFNTCTVYTAKTRFSGGDATFMDSIRFALSKIHLIFMWSLVAASVGILLRALDQMADRMGTIGGTVLGIVQSLLGMMWSVLTIFVVPVMVYEGLGPIDAIKRSSEVLRRTWGESLVRHIGLGLIQFVVMIPGVLMIVAGLVQGASLWPLAVLGVLWMVVVGLAFSVANVVFNTALYEYATNGQVAGGFDSSTMQRAFATNPRSARM